MEIIRENIEILFNSLEIDVDNIYMSEDDELFIETRSFVENEDLVFALLEEEISDIKSIIYDQGLFLICFKNGLVPEII